MTLPTEKLYTIISIKNRYTIRCTEETPKGRRISGKVLTSNADWLLFDPDGFGHLDVRVTFETQDGAHIYVQNYGVVVMNEKVNAAYELGGSPDYGDTYFMTQPRF